MGTVEGDLHRHLIEEERQEQQAEATVAKISEWLSDPVKLPGLIERFLEDQADMAELAPLLAKIYLSDDSAHREPLVEYLTEQMHVYLDEDAAKAVDDDIAQSEVDRAEAMQEARDADREHFGH